MKFADAMFRNEFDDCDAELEKVFEKAETPLCRRRLVLDLAHASKDTKLAVVTLLARTGHWPRSPFLMRVERMFGIKAARCVGAIKRRLSPSYVPVITGQIMGALIWDITPMGKVWGEHVVAEMERMVVPEVARLREEYVPVGARLMGAMWNLVEERAATR
jgi:hypothetical protein